jgi:peptidyl-tRNA hydrolase, PTH1 family
VLLVVGLGNPGREYAKNRHNLGFLVVELLADKTGAEPWRKKFSAEICKTRLGSEDALLLKPQTYMNLSGDSVQPCAAFHKIETAEILVVHDELDLPLGTVRLKLGGGHAGHNGLRSLIGRLGPDFRRIRVGVGRPAADFRGDPADWVLTDFRPDEREIARQSVETAAEAVLDIAARGWQAAMNTRNTRPKPAKAEGPEATEGDANSRSRGKTAGAEAQEKK